MMNSGTDLSFLNGFAPSQGNWTGNTVNIPGLPSAHIGTDPLPVPFWGNVKPAAKTPAQMYQGGASDPGGWGQIVGGVGGDQFNIPPEWLHALNNAAPIKNNVQMPTIGGYTLTADDLAALQTLPDMLWPQTPKPSTTPTVTAQEGDQLPNNAPVYDAQPVSFPSPQGSPAQPTVSTMEGPQIPNNAPIYDSAAYGGQPYQVQAPNITPDIGDLSQWSQTPWAGLTQDDIAALSKTPALPQEGPGTAYNVGMNALGLVPGWGTLANALGGFGVGLTGDHLTQPDNSGNGLVSWLQNRVESPGLVASAFNWGGRQLSSIFDTGGDPDVIRSLGTAYGGKPVAANDPNPWGLSTGGAGAGGTGTDPGASTPWSGVGSVADMTGGMPWYQDTRDAAFPNFMAGAGFGGAGYGYGSDGGLNGGLNIGWDGRTPLGNGTT